MAARARGNRCQTHYCTKIQKNSSGFEDFCELLETHYLGEKSSNKDLHCSKTRRF